MQTAEIKQYKQYLIEADPQKLGSKRWATYIKISRERPGGPKVRSFDDDLEFSNRIDAVKHCFRFAQRIVDGELPQFTVADL
jgi:hypothetical protein